MTEVNAAKEIMKVIEDKGYEVYIVGGYVRDKIMNIDSDDVDISTNMPMDEMEKIFTTYNIGESKDFGIVIVKHEGFDFEVAQFRTDIYEGKFGTGAESTEITNSFEADTARRDFTINSMGMTAGGSIVDFHGGKEDMKNGIIRAVGNPDERFSEDYIRIFRAIRFAARMDFEIEKETYEAIKKWSKRSVNIAGERIKKEFYKMASTDGKTFANSIDMMVDTGIMDIIIPEFTRMFGYEQSKVHHPEGCVGTHVMCAVRASTSTDPVVNMGIMFHDIGKPDSYIKKIDGDITKHTYYSHEVIGVPIWENIARRFNFSRADMDKISAAIAGHMKFHMINVMKQSKVKAIIDNPHFDFIKEVSFADASSKGSNWDREDWNTRMERIEKIKNNNISKEDFKQVVSGKMVMFWMGIKQGNAEVGEIIKKSYEWANNNNVTDVEAIRRQARSMVAIQKKRGEKDEIK
jgi:tRNA nucleotidyltransferase (CCA-adding enzyme)